LKNPLSVKKGVCQKKKIDIKPRRYQRSRMRAGFY
jgi:hypothetical protein